MTSLVAGLALSYVAIAAAAYAVVGSGPGRVALDRRSPPAGASTAGPLSRPSRRLVRIIESGLARTGRTAKLEDLLEAAGKTVRPADLVLILISGSLAGAAVGLALSGAVLALLLALAVPLGAKFFFSFLVKRRRATFADQLDDSLQLLSGSLRAGHSLLRAVDAVAREAEPPTSVEFNRIVNETRVGRELGNSLDDTAERMASDDFVWVAQAIAIHREVGGDLAEVLDTVGHTIRERNQIRRQVKALSAEGRMSGLVLMVLPFGVTGFLMLTNPSYLGKLTQGILGWAMIAAAVILMTVGGLWLRKVVSFRF